MILLLVKSLININNTRRGTDKKNIYLKLSWQLDLNDCCIICRLRPLFLGRQWCKYFALATVKDGGRRQKTGGRRQEAGDGNISVAEICPLRIY
jgi:hypothetical protein